MKRPLPITDQSQKDSTEILGRSPEVVNIGSCLCGNLDWVVHDYSNGRRLECLRCGRNRWQLAATESAYQRRRSA